MGRPANSDADATRHRILQSAISLFSQHGTGATSIRDVAADSKVSLAMVHYYFGSKDHLYDACMAAIYEELSSLRGDLEKGLVLGRSFRGVLSEAIATTYRFARRHQVAVRLLVRASVETGQIGPRGQQVLFGFLDGASQLFAQWLGRPARELRLPLQTAVFLVARYAIQNDDEAVRVVGFAPGSTKKTVRAIEAHLVEVLLALFKPKGAVARRTRRAKT